MLELDVEKQHRSYILVRLRQKKRISWMGSLLLSFNSGNGRYLILPYEAADGVLESRKGCIKLPSEGFGKNALFYNAYNLRALKPYDLHKGPQTEPLTFAEHHRCPNVQACQYNGKVSGFKY